MIKKVDYKGYEITIQYDRYADNNPREWDNLGTIIYTTNRYVLGDERVTQNEIDEIEDRDDVVCLPVYAYIHGAIALNTTGFSCPWDSGKCGLIYTTYEDIKNCFGKIDSNIIASIENQLKTEVEIYNQFINGEVYMFEVGGKCGFGYYDIDNAIEDAKMTVDCFTNNKVMMEVG